MRVPVPGKSRSNLGAIMNRQEAFNKAYLGILAQGCQSLIGEGDQATCL